MTRDWVVCTQIAHRDLATNGGHVAHGKNVVPEPDSKPLKCTEVQKIIDSVETSIMDGLALQWRSLLHIFGGKVPSSSNIVCDSCFQHLSKLLNEGECTHGHCTEHADPDEGIH